MYFSKLVVRYAGPYQAPVDVYSKKESGKVPNRAMKYCILKVLIEFIEQHGEITPKEAENITKKSAATVRRYLKMLVDTRCIVAEGSTNNSMYHVSTNLLNQNNV